MLIGTRIVNPEEINHWNSEIIQISVYHGMKDNLDKMINCARKCKETGIRYVVHPVRYSLLKEEMCDEIMIMAEQADLALILHDETGPDGKRLSGNEEATFRKAVEKLNLTTKISFENSTDTGDIEWFWNEFADSVTLDIGHVESSGLDSLAFVRELDKAVIEKIQFVHMHRHNGLRGGITDHWPLSSDCRELLALKEFLKVKSNVSVILELNEVEKIGESLDILRSLREGLA